MTPKLTAGRRLRAKLDEALAHAAEQSGKQLEWSEQELLILERACQTADRAEAVRELFDAEQAGEGSPAVLVKLSAELRMLDKQTVDFVKGVNPDVGPAKSDRHQRAVQARWDRRDAMWGGA